MEGNNSSVLIKINDLGFSYSHEMDFRTRANIIQMVPRQPFPPHPMIVTENIVGSPAVGTSKQNQNITVNFIMIPLLYPKLLQFKDWKMRKIV